jgi:hypothetical protein
MSDEHKFIAKSQRIKISNQLSTNNNLPAIPTFDLTQMNLVQLAENLRTELNRPRPRTIWFKKRGVKKAELDAEHQRLILSQISNLRAINSELINLQADLFLSPDMLQAIITDRTADIKRKMELFALEHQNKTHSIKSEITARDYTLEAMTLSNEAMRLTNIEKTATVNRLIQDTRMIALHADIIEKIKVELDFNNLTATQAFILIKLLDTKSNPQMEAMSTDAIMSEMINKMKAENAILSEKIRQEEATADDKKNEAEFKKWKNERTKKKDTD